MNTATKIKEIAKQKGIKISYICEQLGFKSRTYFNDIEKHDRDIPSDKLQIIAQILGVTVDYLLGKEDAIFNIEHIRSKDNRITVVGRDGTVIEGELPDDQIELIKLMISQHQKEHGK